MLQYCSEIVSAYYCSQLKKLQSNFKIAAEIINTKWLTKTIEHARFGVNFT